MYKLSRTVLAAVLACWTLGAQAWWGPFFGWFEDVFGSAGVDFNVSMHANGGGWGRYYDYRGPYGYPQWGVPSVQGYPYAPSPYIGGPQPGTDTQTQKLRQDVEAQRLLADRMARRQEQAEKKPAASAKSPIAGFDPFSMEPLPAADVVSPRELERVLEGQGRDARLAPSGIPSKPASRLADGDQTRI
jgi:hypothetical protein